MVGNEGSWSELGLVFLAAMALIVFLEVKRLRRENDEE